MDGEQCSVIKLLNNIVFGTMSSDVDNDVVQDWIKKLRDSLVNGRKTDIRSLVHFAIWQFYLSFYDWTSYSSWLYIRKLDPLISCLADNYLTVFEDKMPFPRITGLFGTNFNLTGIFVSRRDRFLGLFFRDIVVPPRLLASMILLFHVSTILHDSNGFKMTPFMYLFIYLFNTKHQRGNTRLYNE